jgi:hypothetical protein
MRQSASFFNRGHIITSSQPTISQLRQRVIADMRMRRLSPKTHATYLHIVRTFARYRRRRGPARLPVASGRSRYITYFTQCRDQRDQRTMSRN